MSDAEAEAAETQVWIQVAAECSYIDPEIAKEIYHEYDEIINMLVAMIRDASKWTL